MSTSAVRRLPAVEPGWSRAADVVVVGAGAAGLSAALAAAAGGRRVLLLCKGPLGVGATALAQGGLAAVHAADDTVDLHLADTLAAGAGLCDPAAVRDLVHASAGELSRLRGLGARFDPDPGLPGALALTREGGHCRDRVVHAGGDASGAEVARTLLVALRRSSAEVVEHAVALDVLLDDGGTVVGVSVGRVDARGALHPGVVRAPAVVLATGGVGQAWSVTSNPAGATGDGLALALRAGAPVRDVEFVQFHPTVLWGGPSARGHRPLVSEAVRGEGAVLVDATGARVTAGPDGDLAPRDVVSAAMQRRMAQAPGGVSTHLYLDATGLGREVLERRFPTVLASCRAAGVDPVRDPVPVAPGAHYACGGVVADLSGRTPVAGLYAVGEVAATGVHGANRLASNSLPEALLSGRRCGDLLASALPGAGGAPVPPLPGHGVAAATRDATASATTQHAGVLRAPEGLQHLLGRLDAVPGVAAGAPLTLALVESTALHTVATLVATAALERRESRGCHRRSDLSGPRVSWQRHLTLRLDGAGLRLDSVALPHAGATVQATGQATEREPAA